MPLLLVPLSVAPEAQAADVVVARSGALSRVAGQPVPPVDRRIVSATVRHDLVANRLTATIRLAAPPAPDLGAGLGLGVLDGGTCQPQDQFESGFTVSGSVITYDDTPAAAIHREWNCAVVAVGSASGEHDRFTGRLADETVRGPRPRLRISSVQHLEKRSIRLVPGQWSVLDVEVGNTAEDAHAPGTVLTGAGSGIQVRRTAYGEILDGATRVRRVEVRLRKRTTTTLRLTARSDGVTAKRSIRIRPAAVPARAQAGRYRARTPGQPRTTVAFRVAGDKLRGFRTRTQTECGGYPDPSSTYTWNTYDFPATRIPRSGVVDREVGKARGPAAYTVRLRLRIAGGRVTSGYFRYASVANSCEAIVRFTARKA